LSTGTGSRATRVLGVAALAVTAAVAVLGLFITPPDVVQGDLVRLIYVHPAVSTWAFGAFGITALSSVLYLIPRTRRRGWDLLAGSSAEVGVVLCGLSLATGSIWGRPAWGVWWTWDARLTLTALLLALFLGYLALRRTGGPSEVRAQRSAIAGILFSIVVPIDHFATEWWRTLHQGDTLERGKPLIHGQQLATMLASFLAIGLIGAWLLVHRFRLEQLEERLETEGLEQAIAARRAEGAVAAAATSAPTPQAADGPPAGPVRAMASGETDR
jgi:heme exporter protein C